MYTCTRKLEFDAGHRVPLHESKCRTPHGHRYVAEITCAGPALTTEGFVVDFGVIKQIVGAWIDDNWDHTMLYQRGDSVMEDMQAACGPGLRPWYAFDFAPTAENMARYLFDKSQVLMAEHGVRVVRVRLYETPNGWAEWP